MSQSREDYLKFIYENGKNDIISNKIIANGLGIAPPSVSEMIIKLSAEGLVEHIPYHGAKLTELGMTQAKTLIRKHEIWEFFLANRLNYNDQEVHELAEVFEHVTPDDLADRLATYIQFPEKIGDDDVS